ncbi:MAG: hypothetical protein IJE25_07055 [Clostridia bacterium]|nr:hypothetical protein [Clostridia bacterium]
MGFELNGFSTSLGGISWNKTTSSKEMFSRLLFFLESKRILVNPIELEFKDWCIESVLEIKQQLVKITQELKLKDFDADIIRNLIDACNGYLDTVRPMNLPGIIYKRDGEHWEDLSFDRAMKKFRASFKCEIEKIEKKYRLKFHKIIPEEF